MKIAQNDPVDFRRNKHGKGIKETGKAVGEDEGHKEMLRHPFGVAFELDEVLLGSVLQVLREKPFYEFEETQDSNNFEIFEDFEGL